MRDILRWYCESLINEIPSELLVALLIILCVGLMVLILMKGFCKELIRYSVVLLLLDYILLLIGMTVLFRHTADRGFNFMPFWSYYAITTEGYRLLVPENIMNVVVFTPIGLLLGFVLRNSTSQNVLAYGVSLSLVIEMLQFFFCKGFSEFDDVFHNTLGCLAGYGLWRLINYVLREWNYKL